MKRMIRASWNGIVPQRELINLGVPKADAKRFQQYLYQKGYDSGFRDVQSMLDFHDIMKLYNQMIDSGWQIPSKEDNMKEYASQLEDWINYELTGDFHSGQVKCLSYSHDKDYTGTRVVIDVGDGEQIDVFVPKDEAWSSVQLADYIVNNYLS